MTDRSFLDWPFFEDRHRELAAALETWCVENLGTVDHSDTDAATVALVRMLGEGGWLRYSGPDPEAPAPLDVRSLCLIRETLARHDGLADFAFAMQGLGMGAVSLSGSSRQREWLARTRKGAALPAVAGPSRWRRCRRPGPWHTTPSRCTAARRRTGSTSRCRQPCRASVARSASCPSSGCTCSSGRHPRARRA